MSLNCSAGQKLEADPDIAGTGVIIGFTLSAYSTLGIVIAHYLVNQKDNPVDEAFVEYVKHVMPKPLVNSVTRQAQKWKSAMEAAVITSGDTQILTGISILLCAYIQLPSGISGYHWRVVVSLAWFSSLTHLLTLTSLRHFLRNRREMAVWRAVLMGFVMILLVTALGPTLYGLTYVSMAAPALCWFSKNFDPHVPDSFKEYYVFPNVPIIILSIVFLVTNYVTKVMWLFTKVPETLQNWFKSKPSNLLKHVFESAARPTKNPKVKRIKKAGVLLIYVLSKAFYEIFDSMLWEIFCIFLALAWGTLRLILLRVSAAYYPGLKEESKWGFGQILPVLLSFLPLWSAYEQLCINRYEEQPESMASPPPPIPGPDTHWSQLQLRQRKWFRKLQLLIFGQALALAACCFYRLRLSLADGYLYAILISISVAVLIVFTSACLAFQPKKPDPLFERTNWVHESLWICLIVVSVGGVGMSGWWFINTGIIPLVK